MIEGDSTNDIVRRRPRAVMGPSLSLWAQGSLVVQARLTVSFPPIIFLLVMMLPLLFLLPPHLIFVFVFDSL